MTGIDQLVEKATEKSVTRDISVKTLVGVVLTHGAAIALFSANAYLTGPLLLAAHVLGWVVVTLFCSLIMLAFAISFVVNNKKPRYGIVTRFFISSMSLGSPIAAALTGMTLQSYFLLMGWIVGLAASCIMRLSKEGAVTVE